MFTKLFPCNLFKTVIRLERNVICICIYVCSNSTIYVICIQGLVNIIRFKLPFIAVVVLTLKINFPFTVVFLSANNILLQKWMRIRMGARDFLYNAIGKLRKFLQKNSIYL